MMVKIEWTVQIAAEPARGQSAPQAQRASLKLANANSCWRMTSMPDIERFLAP